MVGGARSEAPSEVGNKGLGSRERGRDKKSGKTGVAPSGMVIR